MAWYPEEQWDMISDSIDKKRTAASAFKQRTHCGKGGSIKFPSDFMSAKELKAMNGEVKSYRLNAPLSWNEFVELPNDLKVTYIQSLRDKFGVPDYDLAKMFDVSMAKLSLYFRDLKIEFVNDTEIWNKEAFLAWRSGASSDLVNENDISGTEEPVKYDYSPIKWETFKAMSNEEKIAYIKWIRETFKATNKVIGEMMGVHHTTLAKVVSELGIGLGKGSSLGKGNWPKDEFYTWANGDVSGAVKEVVREAAEETIDEAVEEVVEEPVAIDIHEEAVCSFEKIAATPFSGTLSFESPADQALNMIAMILGTNKVKLRIEWEVVNA